MKNDNLIIIHSVKMAKYLLKNGCVLKDIITDADDKRCYLNFKFERSKELEKHLNNYYSML